MVEPLYSTPSLDTDDVREPEEHGLSYGKTMDDFRRYEKEIMNG